MVRTLKLFIVFVLTLGLVACGSSNNQESGAAEGGDDKVIRVGATLVPHAQILNDVVKGKLEEEGYTLEVVEFSDYPLVNQGLHDGDYNANYFQTLGYMNQQNEANGFKLVAVAGVHIEPMGLYSKKYSVEDEWELEDGAKIGVPNDEDNFARAIDFLNAAGYLNNAVVDPDTLEKGINDNAEVNPHGFVITPLDADKLPITLDDVDASVINGNFALEANLPETNSALIVETFDTETTVKRTNFLVVNEADVTSEKTTALINAITSEEVKKYIEDTYKGAVIPSFIDAEGNPLK